MNHLFVPRSRRFASTGVMLILTAMLFALPLATARAEVVLPKILGSKMVMQRKSEVRFWGRADAGEKVSVRCDWLARPVRTTAAADGGWQVAIRTQKAGGPHKITVTGRNTIVLEDILFGEVWLASGQSNMEMPIRPVSRPYSGVHNWKQVLATADHPEIRLFHVGQFSSKEPLDDVQIGGSQFGAPRSDRVWKACSAESVARFSAVAYFFARELHNQLKVPIGIIDSSWGASAAEEWTPAGGLKALGYTRELKRIADAPQNDGKRMPSRLYNGMIHPIARYRINGAIWYQGESNGGAAGKYTALLTEMLSRWRKAFDHEFSFYIAQLACFRGPADNPDKVGWGPIREAQSDMLEVPKTGLVVTTDIGDPRDIHPKNKYDVGRRLALWALAKDYGRDIVFSGPMFESARFAGGRAIVKFDHTGSGLIAARKPT
ncbi:MAG: sialate O-acetylesterase, partial [Planctomycetota bacterium]